MAWTAQEVNHSMLALVDTPGNDFRAEFQQSRSHTPHPYFRLEIPEANP